VLEDDVVAPPVPDVAADDESPFVPQAATATESEEVSSAVSVTSSGPAKRVGDMDWNLSTTRMEKTLVLDEPRHDGGNANRHPRIRRGRAS